MFIWSSFADIYLSKRDVDPYDLDPDPDPGSHFSDYGQILLYDTDPDLGGK